MSKVQVIKCKCGSVFAACIEEECYIDKKWTRELRKYVLKGCTVDMVEKQFFQLQKCTCKETLTNSKDVNDTSTGTSTGTSQLELF